MAEKTITSKLEDWVERRRSSWRHGTYRNAVDRVGRFVRYAGKEKVTNKLIRAYFEKMLIELHRSTYHCHRMTLRAAFREIGRPDLMEGVPTYRYTSTPLKYFQKHEIERIKKFLLERDPECWLFCQFIYYTFIRPGELRFLKVSDILFDDQKILMSPEVSKNKKLQYITIPDSFREEVTKLRKRPSGEYVFGRKGNRLVARGESTMRGKFRKYLDEMGFSHPYQLYSFKHTGAVAVVKAGVNIKELQIQLRHHNLDMVDRYVRQLGVWDLRNLERKFPPI